MGQAVGIDELTARLERYERERRQVWCSVGLLLAVVLGSVGMTGMVRGRGRVEAESVVLRDRTGKVRAMLGLDDLGVPALVLLDDRGRRQLAVQGDSAGAPGIALYDEGSVRVAMRAGGDGSAGVEVHDREGRTRSTLFMQPDGRTGVGIQGLRGGLDLLSDAEGAAGLSVVGPDGRPTEQVGAPPGRVGGIAPAQRTIRSVTPPTSGASGDGESGGDAGGPLPTPTVPGAGIAKKLDRLDVPGRTVPR